MENFHFSNFQIRCLQKSPSDAPSKKFLLAPYVRSNSRPLLQEHDDRLGCLQVIRGGGSAGAIPKQNTKLNHPIFQLVLTHTSMMLKGFRRWLAFFYDRENIPKKKKQVSVKLHVFVVNSNGPLPTGSISDPNATEIQLQSPLRRPRRRPCSRFERSSQEFLQQKVTRRQKAKWAQNMVSTKGVIVRFSCTDACAEDSFLAANVLHFLLQKYQSI